MIIFLLHQNFIMVGVYFNVMNFLIILNNTLYAYMSMVFVATMSAYYFFSF